MALIDTEMGGPKVKPMPVQAPLIPRYLVLELRSWVASVMREATMGREEEKKPAMQRAAKNMAKLTERPLARKPAQSPMMDRRMWMMLQRVAMEGQGV